MVRVTLQLVCYRFTTTGLVPHPMQWQALESVCSSHPIDATHLRAPLQDWELGKAQRMARKVMNAWNMIDGKKQKQQVSLTYKERSPSQGNKLSELEQRCWAIVTETSEHSVDPTPILYYWPPVFTMEPGMMRHACNSSTLGCWGTNIASLGPNWETARPSK